MIGAAYFDYPQRRHGLDHDRFPMRYLKDAAPVTWPGGAKVALWITVHLEFFPMNMGKTPFLPAGAPEKPYPSHWDYAIRDYGSRVGIYRIMKVLREAGCTASAATNAEIAIRYPALLQEVVAQGWEVVAAGTDMGALIHGDLPEADERALVARSLDTLRAASGQPVTGWHSPGYSQGARTPDILAENGVTYATDWVNDDMPYRMRTVSGDLVQMPLTWFLSDQQILLNQHQRAEEFEHQLDAAFRCLRDEAARTGGGRILSLALTPYVIGQPYRIAALKRLLGTILASGDVWCATGTDIVEAWAAGGGA